MSAPTLYRNGRIYSPADPTATAMLVRDGAIAWLGTAEEAPGTAGATAVDLGGALVTPAFVDAHVHATDTGIVLLGLDLLGTVSAADVLDRVAAHAASLPADAVVLGHGWDESCWAAQTPPSAAELDQAGGGRPVYLSQISVHSAVVSSALLARTPPASPGYAVSGWLRRDAHHVVREIAMGAMSSAQRSAAQRAALAKAASLGIATIHECGGPGTSDESDFTGVLALGREPGQPDVIGYWGELGGIERARDLGASGAAGDLYADGALGAKTAHLREPYLDAEPGHRGHGYITAQQAGEHLIACTRARIQGGFHAIGDEAIGTVLEGFAIAAAACGIDAVRDARHRVEHLEILDKTLIAGLVTYGVTASVQPAFDRLWGGEHAMYAQRLGVARSLASNPIGALAGVGVALAFGSDSPVTPLDPWGTIRAAMRHHHAVSRLGLKTAFAAHTRGGARAARDDESGALAPGAPATFAVWDTLGEPVVDVAGRTVLPPLVDGLPMCLRTAVRGETIFEREG